MIWRYLRSTFSFSHEKQHTFDVKWDSKRNITYFRIEKLAKKKITYYNWTNDLY